MTIPSHRGILRQYRTVLIFLISPNTSWSLVVLVDDLPSVDDVLTVASSQSQIQVETWPGHLGHVLSGSSGTHFVNYPCLTQILH